MSYEQKYLKYKQKYQELKKSLNLSSVHKMQTEVEIQDFVLTDTPTMENVNMVGGGDSNEMPTQEELVEDYFLTETPTNEQYGGMIPLAPASFGPTVPLTTCPGQVNPMPDVSMGLSGVMANMAANPQGPVPPAPVPQVGGEDLPGNDELIGGGDEVASEEFNTTTDVSEIQNTEDIEKLFNQFGGKRGRSRKTNSEGLTTTDESYRSSHSKKSSSSSSSNSNSSGSSSESLSDFDDSLTVSDL